MKESRAAQPSAGPRRHPHGRRSMLARRRDEAHRVATPLELLYDLTIVVAFSVSGSQAAAAWSSGHFLSGTVAFLFSVFAIVWAWINVTWFASAYDNDDWVMRVATLVQMVGVIVLSLGLDRLYRGFEHWELHNEILVIGYVTMRVSMIFLWLRAARDNPDHRPALRRYAALLFLAQLGWVITAFVGMPWLVLLPLLLGLYALELWAIVSSDRQAGGTPWHPHHVAERYGALVIISLGEVILGTTMAVEAVVSKQGWSLDAVLVTAAGISLAVGIWWAYFAIPFGEALEHRPERGFGYQYWHLPLYAAVAAVGAGLHVAANYVEGETVLGELGTILTTAVPVLLFVTVLFGVAHWVLPGRDRFHLVLFTACAAAILGAVVMAWAGCPLSLCLFALMLAPWVLVLGYETRGAGHLGRRLAEL